MIDSKGWSNLRNFPGVREFIEGIIEKSRDRYNRASSDLCHELQDIE